MAVCLSWWPPPRASPPKRCQVAEIRVVWDAFDTDKSGSIDSNELAKILEQLSNGTVGTVVRKIHGKYSHALFIPLTE